MYLLEFFFKKPVSSKFHLNNFESQEKLATFNFCLILISAIGYLPHQIFVNSCFLFLKKIMS